MKTFRDKAGREWSVAVNVTALKAVKELCELDLMNVVLDGGDLIQRLQADPVLLCNVLYAVCRRECKDRSVTDEQFGELMDGDVLASATEALLDEIVNFSPPARRPALKMWAEKRTTLEEMVMKRVEAEINDPHLVDKVMAEMEARLRKTSGDSSGNAAGSPA
jgi:hypothetical protein